MLSNKNLQPVCICKHFVKGRMQRLLIYLINNLFLIDNSQEESSNSNSSATGDFVFLNTSIGKLLNILFS